MFGASSSAAGYNHFTRLVNYMISITILLVSVNYMMVMIYLDNNMYHVSLVSTILISMVIFHLNKHIYDIMSILFISLIRIKLNSNLPIFLTFQKRDDRQFSSVGFAGLLKPTPFEGTHYKRWRQKTILWLTSMNCFHVVHEQPTGVRTSDEERAFQNADITCKAALLSVIGDSLVDGYVPLSTGKAMWDALEARFGVSDAGSELYVMEQFHDYRMVEGRPVVEQAHEIQALVKELELFGCVLPDKFVAGCIIAKLPQSWTDFATSLKHKRQEFSTAELVGTLDVEDKARAKDVKGKKVGEGSSSAHVVQRNRPKPHKKKFQQGLKQQTTTPFKKGKKMNKEKMNCFTCGKTGHFSRECPEAKWKPPPP